MRYVSVTLFVVLSLFITAEASAGCKDCCLTPPYSAITCCGTMYDGGNGCLIYSGGQYCTRVGSCSSGNGPDPCLAAPWLQECTLDQWACKRPTFRELRVVRVDVQPRSAARS